VQKGEREVAELSRRLFEAASAPAHLVLDEKAQLGRTLTRLSRPGISFSVPSPDIGYIKRTTSDGDVYFVVNTSNTGLKVQAAIHAPGMKAVEEWDSFTGIVKEIQYDSDKVGNLAMTLNLAPYQSRLLIVTKRTWPYKEAMDVRPPPSIDLSNSWQVTIGSAPAASWDKLHSWTDDPATRYFSGTASYAKDLNVPAEFLKPGLAVHLNFGEGIPLTPLTLRSGMQAWLEAPVREAAVVYMNDKRVGSVWCPPYDIDVTQFLKPGANRIRIELANTAMNYMAGHSLPDYRLLNLRYGERFQPQDMDKIQALPSGMLGPVRLIAIK